MKCICGFLPVSEGSIRVAGKVIGREIDFPESVGVIIETPGFLSNLTGMRNLEILAGLRRKISREQIRHAIEKTGLDPDLKKSVSKYSKSDSVQTLCQDKARTTITKAAPSGKSSLS